TDCRRRVGAGLPIWYLVPDGIVQYIAKRGLYRGRGQMGSVDGGQ
ncbi:MAG: nicotinic acid mononucleotide adenylyltransferase, partial [Propionibacteriaceae bacterium]|nr:nicotinic acid mononucleotide adenylyltransferase [Propionibacteriaceae bacterium]